MNKIYVLDAAKELLAVDREEDYGDAVENHERIATLWSAYLGTSVSAEQVAICMALLKISRLAHQPGHEDSYLDAAAYVAIAGEASTKVDTEQPTPVGSVRYQRGDLVEDWRVLNVGTVFTDKDGDEYVLCEDDTVFYTDGAEAVVIVGSTEEFAPYKVVNLDG